MKDQDEEMFSRVLSDERTAHAMAEYMSKRGVKFNVPVEEMTHEQLIDACLLVVLELDRRERASSPQGLG